MQSTDIALYELVLKSGLLVDQGIFRHILGLVRIGCSPDVILDMLRYLVARDVRGQIMRSDPPVSASLSQRIANWNVSSGDSVRVQDTRTEVQSFPVPHSRSRSGEVPRGKRFD
ncbi:hypothetical protein AHF37_04584 [Paragonimus kellicotti]|nr:hypothetical protein AHF37_04584 [Paragonimus kellicotti]